MAFRQTADRYCPECLDQMWLEAMCVPDPTHGGFADARGLRHIVRVDLIRSSEHLRRHCDQHVR